MKATRSPQVAPTLTACGLPALPVSFFWAAPFVFLAACGGGDRSAERQPLEPLALEARIASDSFHESTATSLTPPAPTESPLLQAIPPAPSDDPPPRLPARESRETRASAAVLQPLAEPPPPTLLRRKLLTDLQAPTDLAFTTDGVLFFSERTEGLRAWRAGQPVLPVYSPPELVSAGRELGMLSVAVDPEFEKSRRVYTLCVTASGSRRQARVTRLTLAPQSTKLLAHETVVTLELSGSVRTARSTAPMPSANLRFGPDDHLYVIVGPADPFGSSAFLRIDRRDLRSQPTPLAGVHQRMHERGLDGAVAVSFHPSNERVLIGRRGNPRPDDLAMLGAHDQVASTMGFVSVWQSSTVGAGLTAVERLRGEPWGPWRNALVLAFDRAEHLQLVKLNAEGRLQRSVPVLQQAGVGFRALAQGPDGLYVLTTGNEGREELWRLTAW